MSKQKSTKEKSETQIRKIALWLYDHAGELTAEMDDLIIELDGFNISIPVAITGVQEVIVDKKYLIV